MENYKSITKNMMIDFFSIYNSIPTSTIGFSILLEFTFSRILHHSFFFMFVILILFMFYCLLISYFREYSHIHNDILLYSFILFSFFLFFDFQIYPKIKNRFWILFEFTFSRSFKKHTNIFPFYTFILILFFFSMSTYLSLYIDCCIMVTTIEHILSFSFLSFSFSIYKSIPKSKIGSGYFSNSIF
jgi:hypothetical protein